MFSLSKEQLRYFRDNLQIEFEEVFKEDQITHAIESLQQIKRKFIALDLENPSKQPALLKKMLTSLPLEMEPLRKLILSKPIAGLCRQLLDVPSLRFGATTLIVKEASDLFQNYPVACFAKDCSIRPILCGWIVCLEKPNPEKRGSAIWSMTPEEVGMISVFQGDLTIDLSQIVKTEGSYLLCLYTAKDGMATKGDLDLWEPWLKDLGYVFGDPLRSVTHPLVAAP